MVCGERGVGPGRVTGQSEAGPQLGRAQSQPDGGVDGEGMMGPAGEQREL